MMGIFESDRVLGRILLMLVRYPAPHPQQHAEIRRHVVLERMIMNGLRSYDRCSIRCAGVGEVPRKFVACELRPVSVGKGRGSERHPFPLLVFVKHLNTLALPREGTAPVRWRTHGRGLLQ